MSNIEYRSVIKFFTWKGPNAAEISKELGSIQKDDAPSNRTIAKWLAEFQDLERAFEDSLRTGLPSTITSDENIEAVERTVIRDRQMSVHRVADELAIPTTTVYEFMNNHFGMKKVSTTWVRELLSPI